MGFSLTSREFAEYLKRTAAKIAENKDYITELDAATGDGDHWANMNAGFSKLAELAPQLAELSVSDMYKQMGMTMMSTIGGSSGVLYGSAYIAAAKVTVDIDTIDVHALFHVLEAMLQAIMDRGSSKPGFKTMIDALYPAVEEYRTALEAGVPETVLLQRVKKAAEAGAENTKNMEAVRGRACYQSDKGIGHLDPGAVTMAYQIEELTDFILDRI